ncbi:hypothetical protein FQN50_004839 [Emmonsiellopsis sp. PD_5]|nr:hypothetical protein FQN50_004839 [Emmonsiellopsis sp. PD_5]
MLNECRFNAPLDPTRHYNDDNHQDSDVIAFNPRLHCFRKEQLDVVGYSIHQSCWRLLENQAERHGVKFLNNPQYTDFLYQLYQSAFDGSGREYTNEFGGLLDLDKIRFGGYSISPVLHDAVFDPADIKQISILIRQARDQAVVPLKESPIFGRVRNLNINRAKSWSSHGNSRSFLHALPFEIILMIIEYIPTASLLDFWIAFPGAPDYMPQRFWRSRFGYGMDFGHLFEFEQIWNANNIPWYTLFWKAREMTNSHTSGPPIRNRRRILPIVDQLVKLAIRYENKEVEGIEQNAEHPVLLQTDGFSLHKANLSLPPSWEIRTLHLSTVWIGSRQYICGLRINESGLGYHHHDTSERFEINMTSDGFVQEFLIHMDRFGLRGLQLITSNGSKYGIMFETSSSDELSMTVLPVGKQLIGHFDATKITAFGVDEPIPMPRDSRNSLLWRTALPPVDTTVVIDRHMYHEIVHSFAVPCNIKYNPVQYHIFRSQETLLGITAYTQYRMHMRGLEFTYKSIENSHCPPSHSPTETVSFGERDGTRVHFPIDGPSGERITDLYIITLNSLSMKPLLSLSTNRGRRFWFTDDERFSKGVLPKDMFIEKHHAPKPDEKLIGLLWASGGSDKWLSYIWNFGLLCRSTASHK